ncbi:MAG: ankyrin repeat domain-containing protein [Puniceicoccales bacterium]|jgi:ankyrin repeat protein|nr:ankyrin repeat domain-containing protein [Puniceicoccales bacterium]
MKGIIMKKNNTTIKNITLGSVLLSNFMGSGLSGSLWQPQTAQKEITYNIQATQELEKILKGMEEFEYDSYDKFRQIPNFFTMMNFINRGANPCAENNHHWTLWHFAAKFNRWYILPQFIEKIKNSIGQEYLVKYFNKKNDMGRTPLHEAIINNSNEVVQNLIFNGANLAAKDNFGQTPLHTAAMVGNLIAIKALFEAIKNIRPDILLAYVNTLDRLFQTPLDSAKDIYNQDKRFKIISELRLYGAKTAEELGKALFWF